MTWVREQIEAAILGATQEVDMVTAVQTFLAAHDDAYDYVVVFNTLGIGAAPGAPGAKHWRCIRARATRQGRAAF